MKHPSALSQLAKILGEQSIEWTLIGALAANRYRSSPRLTNDVDILLANTGKGIETLEAALTNAGWSVYRADSNGELLRLKHQTMGVADLLVSGTAYQKLAIARSLQERVGDEVFNVLTIEDVILHKLIAGRYQDLADIEAILETGLPLDFDYLDDWLEFWDLRDAWSKFQKPSG